MSEMNLDQLQQKLLAAARATPPDDQVPYAFEQRVMAHLRLRSKTDPLGEWAAWLWRSAVSGCAVAAVLAAVNLSQAGELDEVDELDAAVELAATHLENALYAPALATVDAW
jgi:anti-sigma-K factor RskA